MIKDAVEWHTVIAKDFDAGYSRSKNFKERLAKFSQLIKKFSASHKNVIDLGCGAGIFSLYAATLNGHVTGIDGSETMVSIGKDKQKSAGLENLDFVVKDITTLPTNDLAPADLIICSSVLEYIDNLEKSVALIDKLLIVDGIAIVSMPNKLSIYRRIEKLTFSLFKKPKYYRFVKNIVSAEEMIDLFAKQNFEVIETHYFSSAPILSNIFFADCFKKWTKNLFVIVAKKQPHLTH